jgi:hypothetical protein
MAVGRLLRRIVLVLQINDLRTLTTVDPTTLLHFTTHNPHLRTHITQLQPRQWAIPLQTLRTVLLPLFISSRRSSIALP